MVFELDGELDQNAGCQLIKVEMESYLNGELDDEVSQLIRDHVCSCKKCDDFLFEKAFDKFKGGESRASSI